MSQLAMKPNKGFGSAADIERSQIEDFLFHEADLLDRWRLPEWLDLFTETAVYHVPPTDIPADASPDTNLFYIADDRFRLGERVKRLMKRTAHAEYPHSRTRRLITNVTITDRDADGLGVTGNFAVFRTKDGASVTFFGQAIYRLVIRQGSLLIDKKRIALDTPGLREQGRLSIIL